MRRVRRALYINTDQAKQSRLVRGIKSTITKTPKHKSRSSLSPNETTRPGSFKVHAREHNKVLHPLDSSIAHEKISVSTLQRRVIYDVHLFQVSQQADVVRGNEGRRHQGILEKLILEGKADLSHS